jgi:hypothetical protein
MLKAPAPNVTIWSMPPVITTFLMKWNIWFGDAERREDGGSDARLKADDHQDAAANLDRDRADVSKWCGKRKRGRVDQIDRPAVVCEFAEAARCERQSDQEATDEGKISRGIHGGFSPAMTRSGAAWRAAFTVARSCGAASNGPTGDHAALSRVFS